MNELAFAVIASVAIGASLLYGYTAALGRIRKAGTLTTKKGTYSFKPAGV